MNEEISALVTTLHETQQRLEELTEGEVDAVADREGRTFLLRRAQDKLRHSEAAKLAAILDALPAQIALLDTQGVILAVNENWRFSSANANQSPGHAIGINYLEQCGAARGENASDARQIAQGIRAVLGGELKSFSFEYPCGSPSDQQWSQLSVSPLAGDRPSGVVVMHVDITERKRAEEEQLAAQSKLAESEQRLRTIFETEPECVKVVSKDMVLLDMNAAGLAMLGADSLAEAQAQPLADFVVPEYRAAFADLHARVMRGESGFAEFQVIGLKGGRRWLETHAAPLGGGKGRAANLLGITRDITARKEADEQIKRGSEALRRFSSAMDATADAIYLVDRSSMGFIHVNDAACRMQGRTREELVALGPEGVLSIPRAELERTYDSIIASGVDAEPLEILRRRRDGTDAWVELRRHALHSKDGWTIVTLVRDVTERKQSQHSIAREKNFISAMLDNLPGLFYLVNDKGQFIRWNSEFELISGYSSDEVARLHPTDFFADTEKQAIADAMGQVFVTGKAETEANFTAKDGTSTPYFFTGRRVQFDQAPHLIGMAIDVSERKEALRKLHESEMRFRSLTALSSDWFWEQDAEHRFVEFSGGENVEGWGPDQRQAIGLHRWDLDGVAPLNSSWEEHKGILNKHEPFRNFEYRRILTDGRLQYVAASGEPIFDPGGRFTGYRGVATEITARKLDAIELQRSNSLKSSILQASLDCIVTMDHEGRIVEFNPAAEATFGFERGQALGKELAALIVPLRHRDAHREGVARFLATGEGPILGKRIELEALRADGTEFPVELAITPLGATAPPMFTGFIRDISERRKSEDRIRRLNRVYAVLSGINMLIVRVRDREELFRESCRIAVEHGGFRMSWIGIVDKSLMVLRPVASAGTTSDFHALVNQRFSLLEEEPRGNSLAARAIRDKVAAVSNDVRSDPRIVFKDEHAARGSRSMAILPLAINGDVTGLLTLYSGEAGFFDDEEMNLLTELAGDVAFAVDHIEKAAKLARVTRVNAMLSDINGAIVRIHDRRQLFEETCRIAVETGSLPFAWLGVVNASETALQVVASAGRDDGFLQTIRDRLALRGDTPDSESLSWRAVRERRAVVVNDVAADTVLRSRTAFAERGIRSVAVFPLLVAGRVAGAFALHSEQAGFFDDDEMRLLIEVAANISFALEYMEREEKVRRLTRVNAVLSGINAAIVHIRDRQELFEESCRIALEVGGLRFVWLGVVDEMEERLRLAASAGGDPGFLETIGDRLSLREDAPAGHGVGARSVLEKRPVAMNDAETESYQRYRKSFAERGIKSIAAFPLLIAGRAVGTFALHAAEAGFFDEDEMRLLGEVTANIAFATEHIQEAQKLARLTRSNAILSGINGAIVQMRDRDRLFQEVCRIAVETGGLPFAWLCVVDRTGEKLEPVGYAGPDDGFMEMISDRLSLLDSAPLGQGISARSVLEKRTIRVGDVAESASIRHRQPYARRGIRSSAAFPLLIGGRAIGSFSLCASETNFFDNEQVKLLEEVARNIAFALEHMEKEEKVRRLTRVYAVLSGITALAVHVRDRQVLFNEACRIAVSEGEFVLARVIDVDPAGKARIAATTETDTSLFQRIVDEYNADPEHSRSILRLALRTRQPIVSNDVATDARIPHRAELTGGRSYALTMLPLIAGPRLVGTLILRAPMGAFNDDENRLLLEMTANISLALERIEQEERLGRMTRVNAMLSGINGAIVRIRDRQALFEEACRIAVETGGLPFAWMSVVDEKEKLLRPVASAGGGGNLLDVISIRLSVSDDAPEGYGLSARSIREKRALVANDIATSDDIRHKQPYYALGVRSIAAIPLMVGNRPIGGLVLHAAEAGFFDDDEMRLLREVADNIAFALEHMEQEEKVRRLTRVYAVLSGINTLIVRVRDRNELFRESCRIAVDAGAFAKAWIGTIESESRRFRIAAAHGGDPQFFPALETELAKKVLDGRGLVARAISTLQPVVTNDATNDPDVLLKDDLRATDVRSAAVLPLVVSGVAVGVLVLNSDVQGFFDDEEMVLLAELARDIAFAIDHIGQQERLDHFAYYDELTGLANRNLFLERLAQHMRSAVTGGHKLALFYLDLERFRNINDSLGRPAGDAVLKQVSEWLVHNVGDASLLARLGADNFAIVLPEVRRDGDVARLLDKRIRALHEGQFRVENTDLRLTARVGVALFPNDGTDAATLIANAEAALKNAKSRGDRFLFYTQKMTEAVVGKLTLESRLRRALDNEEFVLHYQPKVNLESGKLTSAEALIRWNDPQTGLVPPGKFIPILEETGLIYDVGRWALRKAIADYLRWRAAGLPAVRIAVNVSPLQLRNRGFVAEIQEVVATHADASAGLEIEITESVIMEDVKNSIATLQAIRAMGVTIAIDDFGTGFSSLSHLARLPVDKLKIDRSFVTEMTSEAKGLSLVSTIISLAHALKLKVVAEGVETEEQSRLLRLLRCDEMQGFLFSKPVPAEIFEARFLAPQQVAPAANSR